MSTNIRLVRQADIQAVVELSLAAWPEVHESFENLLGTRIFKLIWPNWRDGQAREVRAICEASLEPSSHVTTWVAVESGNVAGFIACRLNRSDFSGEVEYLAVHPRAQGRGIAHKLNLKALQHMKHEGMHLAVVATGGDPAHAAARRAYEKAGYSSLPLVRYYQHLGD
jgi:ribosomal protein S18 acetylase RimI-like enzyme